MNTVTHAGRLMVENEKLQAEVERMEKWYEEDRVRRLDQEDEVERLKKQVAMQDAVRAGDTKELAKADKVIKGLEAEVERLTTDLEQVGKDRTSAEIEANRLKTATENLQVEVERLREALTRIRKYGEGGEYPDGICPHGCDCPDIARQTLASGGTEGE